jgi:hypothetical protein
MDFENLVEEQDKPYNIRHRCFFFSKDVILSVKEWKYDKVFYS